MRLEQKPLGETQVKQMLKELNDFRRYIHIGDPGDQGKQSYCPSACNYLDLHKCSKAIVSLKLDVFLCTQLHALIERLSFDVLLTDFSTVDLLLVSHYVYQPSALSYFEQI